jgi:MAF protein
MSSLSRSLVLASTSPYRKALLDRLELSFLTYKPDVNEARQNNETPEQLVIRLAESKAQAAKSQHPDALIIGSDQVAVCENTVLGKPGSHEIAVQQLQQLSGQQVSFLTGLCLLDTENGDYKSTLIPYSVIFRQLNDQQIEQYLLAEKPYNCAGSFKSEGLGISLFERMEGDDPTALIGLPLIQLVTWLNEAGVEVP